VFHAAGAYRVVAVEWYDGGRGFCEPGCPVLAVCLDNGRMQLMRHDVDDNAVCIDTGMRPVAVKWNNKGSVRGPGDRGVGLGWV
jgi:WD repeat-containing protein 35